MTMAPLYRPHLVVWLLILVSFAMLNVVRQTSSFNASVRLLSDEDLNWQLVAVPSGTQRAIEDGFENASGLMPSLMNTTDPPSVCFYGDTRFFLSENSTYVFAKELLTFLGEVALRSFNEALSTGKIHVMIPITKVQPHFADLQDLVQFVKPLVEKYEHLNIDFSTEAYNTTAGLFNTTNCEWVVSVKLDADDVLAPGYLDWIADKIIPTLDRGALVASRRLPRLNYGFNRCYANPKKGLQGNMGTHATCPYWTGWSVGQTRIFRRDVFEALGMPFQSDPHALALSKLRSAVFWKILKKEPPASLKSDFKLAKNFTLFNSKEAEMENATGIKMVETTDGGFGPAGIYMKTPMSSHFPFGKVRTFARCSPDKWAEAVSNATTLNTIKGTYDYLYD